MGKAPGTCGSDEAGNISLPNPCIICARTHTPLIFLSDLPAKATVCGVQPGMARTRHTSSTTYSPVNPVYGRVCARVCVQCVLSRCE